MKKKSQNNATVLYCFKAQMLLEFQKQILTEIVTEDGLLIISPGLGLFQILCSLIQVYSTGNHLILLLNTTKAEDDLIQEQLIASGVTQHTLRRIEYNTTAEKRSSMYRESGLFSITSRILAVDMLLGRIPTSLINGIIVANADRVKPHSIDELVLRIYREHNQEGFIKALSDRPEAFASGFAPLQTTLKTLLLRKVHVWPRFQVLVAECLSSTSNNVIELRQPMTEAMQVIQQNLVHCLEETLTELRRSNPTIDVGEFTMENAFSRSFDQVVRRQLDPIWHRVSPASKQLVGDLKILRQLLNYLTTYDCVSFYSFIETVIAANTSYDGKQVRQSQWLFLEAGDKVITTARKRVYLREQDPEYDDYVEVSNYKDESMPKHIKLTLEEQPKWGLLSNILEEIEQDSLQLNAGDGAPTLIMVSERRTCSQLQKYIVDKDRTEFLNRIARNFFRWRASIHQIQTTVMNQASTAASHQSTMMRGRPPPNKRRRVRGGSSTAASSHFASGRSYTLAETFRNDIIQNMTELNASTPDTTDNEDENDSAYQGIMAADDNILMSDDSILPTFDEIPNTTLITIQCYDDNTHEQVLEDAQPRFIILFDPNPAFIRQIEVYRARHPSVDVRVYFMVYEDSVEEQNYLSLIRKEKESFERLIHEKSVMAIPLPDQQRKEAEITIPTNSRLAGGQLRIEKGPQLVTVDMREFRSSLPPILYAEGIKIVPCTLQVGDYILSPDMCVERKSLSDLIQSFNSGRLYTQCENMSLYYKMPILLIEFDENKTFSLQGVSDLRENIRATDLSSKLVLLTLAFPKLRIIWSSSPHETAKIFLELKKTEEEPNTEAAAAIGAEENEDGETIYNMTPQDILRSMPGVNSKNYKIIMSQVDSLDELMHLSLKKIQDMIGEEMGRKLYTFLRKKKYY
ncbi:MAG: hypothetical protein EXX96DRAFT_575678, partial [Benjaminiella poitrasii]